MPACGAVRSAATSADAAELPTSPIIRPCHKYHDIAGSRQSSSSSSSQIDVRVIDRSSSSSMATSSRRMRAVQYDKYGGGAQGLKHVEVPIPAPKKGEVLIRVEAASINQVDWKFQKGIARPFLPKKFPFTPGYDLAGEVVELGSGVSCFEVGDKVIAINFPDGGGLAEYAVARASRTAEDMELLVGMAREGRLKAVIESRCPLSRAEECWAKSMSGHVTGKAVVVVGEEE
uniref:Alcohol dehydrogenase-like N-terminal domain-containing protein n=1 Tax=Oryza brachyantha TaxID=4533 RepID=J3MYX4_ORYBR